MSQAGKNERELVSAQTRDRVAGTHALLQPLRDLNQQPVTHAVTHRIVDDLEAVQISKNNTDSPVVALRLLHRLPETVEKQASVGQPRKRIELGQIGKPLLGTFAINRGREDIGKAL